MKGTLYLLLSMLRRYYFPVMVAVALGVYLTQIYEGRLPMWANNHLNDFLCMPIVLKVCQSAVRYLKSDRRLTLPWQLQTTLALVFCLYFEGYLPPVSTRYTADLWDMVMYALGTGVFYQLENRSPTIVGQYVQPG